jgi:hypothetical protein
MPVAMLQRENRGRGLGKQLRRIYFGSSGSPGKYVSCDRQTLFAPFSSSIPLAKLLEAYTKRQLTETPFVVVAAGGEGTKTALFLCYTHRLGWIGPA